MGNVVCITGTNCSICRAVREAHEAVFTPFSSVYDRRRCQDRAGERAVQRRCGEYIVGVFNDGETIDPHSSTYVCNYPGWILTQQEYTELNDDAHENMGALFGIDVPLQAFVRKHWNPTWDPAWKEVEWVVLGDPVSTGGNFNTLSGIPNKAYNCEFRINNRAEYKVLTKDGRYSVISEVVTIHRQKAATIRTGVELFVAYDNLIRAKKRLAAE